MLGWNPQKPTKQDGNDTTCTIPTSGFYLSWVTDDFVGDNECSFLSEFEVQLISIWLERHCKSTVGANKKFTFRFCSTVRTILFRFYGILHFCVSTIADSAIIGFHKELVIFDTTCSVRSKLSTWNKVEHIAKTCRYNISKNHEKLFYDSFKHYKLMGWGLATIDCLPTVSLVLEWLQTRDKDCHMERL